MRPNTNDGLTRQQGCPRARLHGLHSYSSGPHFQTYPLSIEDSRPGIFTSVAKPFGFDSVELPAVVYSNLAARSSVSKGALLAATATLLPPRPHFHTLFSLDRDRIHRSRHEAGSTPLRLQGSDEDSGCGLHLLFAALLALIALGLAADGE
jgi:hypothetical protein